MYKQHVCNLIYFLIVINNSWNIYCDEDFLQNSTIETEESTTSSNNGNDFGSSTYILLDILKFLPRFNISEKCYKDIKLVEAALDTREIWAIKGILIKCHVICVYQ